jgi:hypothetical protein
MYKMMDDSRHIVGKLLLYFYTGYYRVAPENGNSEFLTWSVAEVTVEWSYLATDHLKQTIY